MKRQVGKTAFLALMELLLCVCSAAQVSIMVDPRDSGRVFDGIGETRGGGAVSRLLIAYPEPERSQILDYLFKPNYGASLQMLKVEIGGDGNSTEGSEPSHMHVRGDANYNRGVELWLAEEAKRRNPDIKLIALAWTFLAWLKSVDSDNTLNYLVDFIEGARRVHHLDFDYIGFWNESKYSYDVLPRLRRALDARMLLPGLSPTTP
jgi:galactosylceramidase